MTREDKDKIARNAASTWCRCFCDGIVKSTNTLCDSNKEIMETCSKWHDGYRTAMIALEDIN